MAFLMDLINGSQKSFTAFKSINNFLDNSDGLTEIAVFAHTRDHPIIFPLTAIFHTNDLRTYTGKLIVCDLQSYFVAARQAHLAEIYYYIFTPQELSFLTPNGLIQIKTIPKDRIFVRNEDHKKLLRKQFGIDCNEITVEDFSIADFMKGMK